MKKFQVKSLTIKDFKGVTTQEFYEFGNEIVIQGDNFTGKTTIAEAILFAIYGVDLQGSSRTDALVNKDLKRGKCEVSVVLETDQGEFKISRSATKTKKFIKFNKNEVSQKEVFEIVGEMDLFIVSYLPSHVLSFKDKEAREYFMKFVNEVDPAEVLKELGSFAEPLKGLNLSNVDELKKNLREESKEFERSFDWIDGRMTAVRDILKQSQGDKVDVTKLEIEIKKLDDKLYEPIAAPLLNDTTEIKAAIKKQYENMMNIKIEKPILIGEPNKAQEIQEQLMNMESVAPYIELNTSGIKAELNEITAYYKRLKTELNGLLSPPKNCPTCFQEIKSDEETINRSNERKAELEILLSEATDDGKILRVNLEKIEQENVDLELQFQKRVEKFEAEKEKLNKSYRKAIKENEEIKLNNQKSLEKYEADLSQVRKEAQIKYNDLSNQLTEIELENKKITNEKTYELNEYRKSIQSQLAELREQLTSAKLFNRSQEDLLTSIEEAKTEKLKLEQNIRDANEVIERNKAALDALNEYIGEYAKMQSGQINKHFNKVSIQLSEVVKTTGEMKPKFKLLYDEKPIEVLSLSERIRLGLEVSSFIKTVTNTAYPTFIDNAESITEFDRIPGQLFTATVVKGSELIVN